MFELAARAAGYTYRYDCGTHYIKGTCLWYIWDPLDDDGDALRLAVALRLRIATECNQSASYASDVRGRVDELNNRGMLDPVPWNGDPYSATRSAIFRAAVEIGKTMDAGLF